MSKLVVFDIDGTLNRTDLYSVDAMKRVFKEMGIKEKTDDEIKSFFGYTPDESVRKIFGEIDECTKVKYLSLLDKYENELMKKFAKPFDGIPELLEKLKKDYFELAVCSNASESHVNSILKVLKIYDYFDYIQSSVPNKNKEYTLSLILNKVNPEKACIIGDRIQDKNAAISNNIPFIGCLYGFCPNEVKDADITVKSAYELYENIVEILN